MTITEPRIDVVSEPLTYREDVLHSFFADLARTNLRRTEPGFDAAAGRLDRHRAEMDVEKRLNPRASLGFGGEFSPPLWVIDKFATPARAGRVIADLVQNMYLPAGVHEVHVPVLTTGATETVQGVDGVPASETDQITGDVAGNKTVVTIAGDVDAAQQLFDLTPMPGYDGLVYTDLNRAYNEALERQLTAGTGTNGQLTGVAVITGRQSDVAGSGVSVTQATGVPQIKPLIGQAMAAVGNNRKLPVTQLIMAPRRWAWIASDVSEIAQTQIWPLPGYQTVGEGQLGPIDAQPFAGLPTYQSAACMSGAITATDVAIVLRYTDMYLYESDPYFVTMENPLSGTLEVRLQLRKYVSFPIVRPAGICCVTALPAPTAFGA